jgi:hypothetical protein
MISRVRRQGTDVYVAAMGSTAQHVLNIGSWVRDVSLSQRGPEASQGGSDLPVRRLLHAIGTTPCDYR